MSTSDRDSSQQTAFLTSAASGLATMTTIYNGSSSALPTLTAMIVDNNTPNSTLTQVTGELPPNAPEPTVPAGIPPNPTSPNGSPAGSSPATGKT